VPGEIGHGEAQVRAAQVDAKRCSAVRVEADARGRFSDVAGIESVLNDEPGIDELLHALRYGGCTQASYSSDRGARHLTV